MDLGLRKDFMNLTPKTREVKAKINALEYIKLKGFAQQKKLLTKQKGNQPNERRYLQTIPLVRGQYPIYKELIPLNNNNNDNNKTIPFKKRQRT